MTTPAADPAGATGGFEPTGSMAPAGSRQPLRWVVDLDGVMWRGSRTIDGSVEAATRLVDAGHSILFCTNHAESPASKTSRLAEMGIPGPVVTTSAEAAAHMCGPQDRILVLGEPGLTHVFRDSGALVTDVAELDPDGPVPTVDVVVVGASSNWDRARTGLAADAIRSGARFIATNDDPTYPYSGPLGPKLLPGAGALVAAVATTAGAEPVVAGKPNRPAADLVLERMGAVDFVVGDRDDTDGRFARALGARFVLVLSGATSQDMVPTDPAPDLVAGDFAGAVETVLGGSSAL